MREIDDRYPEFAEPNEPVKRGKHKKGLTWSFPAVAGVFVLTLALLNAQGESSPVTPPGPPEPPEPPAVEETRIVTVAISVESEEETYSGREFEITPRFGFTAEEEGRDVTDLVSVELKEGTVIKAADAGEYPFDLTSDSFEITAEDFDKCEVVVNDGTLKILPADLAVSITGNTLSTVYNGSAQSVSGYSVSSDRSDYTYSDFIFSGDASAGRTNAGTTYMGLSPGQFTNKNDNFNVTFDVTDGYIRINRANVNVSITGSSETSVYDGEPHSVSGYSTSIDNGNYSEDLISFSGTAEASRTDAGTTYMGLAGSQFTNKNDNFNVTFSVTDGYVQIDKADVNVTVTGIVETAVYDGEARMVRGYEIDIDNSDYTEDFFTFSGTAEASRTDAGTTYMGLASSQFTNKNDNFNVTFNVTDGYIQIDKADVNVTVTGTTETAEYDGEAHIVMGYDTQIDNSLYNANYISFSGTAEAYRTEVGITYMGLDSSQFSNTNDNFSVVFSVTDGYIEITEPDNLTPVIKDLDVRDNLNLDLIMFAGVFATLKPGDELSKDGGMVDAWVYVKSDTADTFDQDTEYPFHYDFDGDNSEIEIEVVHRMPENMWMARETGKLVVQYTFPDGTTDTYESEEFYMYKGSFVGLNTDYGDDGVLASGSKVEVDLIFTQDIEFENGGTMTVLPENVNIDFAEVYLSVFDSDDNYVEDMSYSKEMPDETEFYTDSDGIMHWHLTFNFSEDVIPPDSYSVYPDFYAQFTDTPSGWNAVLW